MNGLLAAIRLLTVIPIGNGATDARSIAQSPAFFPVVGLAIGAAMAVVNWSAALVLPGLPAAALAVAAGVALTGAIHIDGLADTFDGLFGGRTPQRRLEIMRDPAIGTFGATAVGLLLILKWSAVSSMGGPHAWAAIALAPMLGRLAAVTVMASFPYARPEGLGTAYSGGAAWALAGAAAFSTIGAVALLGPWAMIVLGAAGAMAFATGRFASSRLGGGVTGDVYGAVVELTEAAALLLLSALLLTGLALQPVWV
ncbi:MAG: adenosylcobinamide-GDP ribazoletransferase [Dehalococcoidia bacterium]